MPQWIYFWEREGTTLLIPRGFAWKLRKIIKVKGLDVVWSDRRVEQWVPDHFELDPIKLKPHQIPAVNRIIEVEQGIYQGPTGSGKTVTMLEAIRRSRQKSIVIVNSKHILRQWQDRCMEYFNGYEPGLIGDSDFQIENITIAMQQTLWRRKKELTKNKFWNQWGLICLDECHHASADTFKYVIGKFPARYRIGVSATPDKNQENPIAQSVLGEIFHFTTEHEVSDVIIKPQIKTIETDFRFMYTPTFRVSARNICTVPGCRKKGNHVHRNNFQDLLKKIASDPERNLLIGETLLSNRGHANLLISRSLEHLDNINSLAIEKGWPEDRIFLFTGKQSAKERQRIMHVADEGDIALLSTVADEALDIPRLDRLYIIWPTRNPDLITQQIGRIRRRVPGKLDAIVYDFVDRKVGVLNSQYRTREQEVYSQNQIYLKAA